MDKFEKMEELKIAMMRKVIYREEMPAEIYGIVKESFEGVLNRYNNMACNNLSIQEYMQGNLEYIKFYINEKGRIVIVFEKYEIAPGYMGTQEFEIDKQIKL